MCGIAGILRVHPAGQPPPPPWESIPERWLDILDDSIKHRGPDGAGRFRDRAVRADGSTVDVALVHRRLSIIDHAGGHQPMVSMAKGAGVVPVKTYALDQGLGLYEPEGYERLRARSASEAVSAPDLVAVVFNGCIYNHRELRKELQAAGHVFSTDHSDTEVLVHGTQEWNERVPTELEGMFAYAAWCRASATLTLSRDWVGEKPLYLAHWRLSRDGIARDPDPLCTDVNDLLAGDPLAVEPCLFAFGSGMPGLLRLSHHLGLRQAPGCIYNWVELGFDPSGPPVHPGIKEIRGIAIIGGIDEAGRSETLRQRDFKPSWWTWDTKTRRRNDTVPTADQIDRLLEASVRSRLESDVPMSCFLSGGVDSPLLALYAKRALGDFSALTVKMPDSRYDESETAARLASLIGVRHTILDADPRPADDVVRLIQMLGLPFGDSSLLPSFWVSQAARRHVTVALGGDGGDELFAGYERYVAAELTQRSSIKALRRVPKWMFAGAHPRSRRAKVGRLAQSLDPLEFDVGKIFSFRQLEGLTGGLKSGYGLRLDGPGAFASGAAALIDRDFCDYLPGDLLRKTDTASMAVALEVRSPYLDFDLMHSALCAPISALMPHNQRKGLLRQVARKYFPPEIVDRPKMGFAIPIGEWFRSNHGGMRDLLLDHLNSAEPFGPPSLGIDLNMAFVRQMLKEHDDAGQKSLFPWKGRDHSQRLYMLLVLSIWAKWLGRLQGNETRQ